MRDYVCVNELELPSDIGHLRTIDGVYYSFYSFYIEIKIKKASSLV